MHGVQIHDKCPLVEDLANMAVEKRLIRGIELGPRDTFPYMFRIPERSIASAHLTMTKGIEFLYRRT